MKDERLERLSDEVRKGHPIDMSEAFEVIEYQSKIRKIRDSKKLSFRIKKLLGLEA